MCLNLQKDWREETNKLKSRKVIYGYKIIQERRSPNPYREYIWHKGLNISSRKSINLNNDERHYKEVYKGFHFYLNRQDAINDRYVWTDYPRVICCRINPEDIVAVGVDVDSYPNFVATKCTWSGKYIKVEE